MAHARKACWADCPREFESRILRVKTFVTRRLTVDAVQYDGTNYKEIAGFAGPQNTREYPFEDAQLQVLYNGTWTEVPAGWWVTKDTVSNTIELFSEKTFNRYFREPIAGEY